MNNHDFLKLKKEKDNIIKRDLKNGISPDHIILLQKVSTELAELENPILLSLTNAYCIDEKFGDSMIVTVIVSLLMACSNDFEKTFMILKRVNASIKENEKICK